MNLDVKGIKGIDVEMMKDVRNENSAQGSNTLLYIMSPLEALSQCWGLSHLYCPVNVQGPLSHTVRVILRGLSIPIVSKVLTVWCRGRVSEVECWMLDAHSHSA